jgi:hypothetical protein
MLHFIIFHPDKLNRPGVVECAAKVDGILLNSMLKVRPRNIVSVLCILLRFHAIKYVISANIKEMFLQFPIYVNVKCFLTINVVISLTKGYNEGLQSCRLYQSTIPLFVCF